MSDIDFEELDNAVNKLVNKDALPAPVKLPSNIPSTPPPTPIVKQARGQYMELVHTPGEIIHKQSTSATSTESSVYPARKIVTPINDIIAHVTTEQSSHSPSPPVSNQNSEPVIKNDWPDPIDAATSASLFLPDAKVEKRPLGGTNQLKPNESSQPSALPEMPKTEDNQSIKETSLPPELEANLVAIEEGEPTTEETAAPPKPEPLEDKPEPIESHPSTPYGTSSHTTYIEAEPSTSPVKSSAPTSSYTPKPLPTKSKLSGLLGTGSIPQQYKTAASTTSGETTHPMFFDADQYDKNLATHKPKSAKTTAFQWIFIVVGLLLLGATLGAALFVFVSSK